MEDDLKERVRQRFLERIDEGDWDDEDPRINLGTEALPHFIDAVKRERDPRRRSRLVRVVWQFRDRSALPILAEALQDSDDLVWKDALDGIVTLGGDQALQLLHDAQRAMLGVGEPVALTKLSWITEAIEQVHADIRSDDSKPLWKRKHRQPGPPKSADERTRDEWRDLGFCCALDKTAKAWRLTGSHDGLLRFRDLLLSYAGEDPGHYHLGPYFSPTLTTGAHAKIDERGIGGALADFARLAELIDRALDRTMPGSMVVIRDEFAAEGGYSVLLDVKPEGFDPASADPWRLLLKPISRG
jgi:hypothetical protein